MGIPLGLPYADVISRGWLKLKIMPRHNTIHNMEVKVSTRLTQTVYQVHDGLKH